MRSKLAIEIGAFYTKIYKEKQDIVLYEPTLIIIKNNNYKEPVACGLDAEKMLERIGNDCAAIRPVGYSSITDQTALTVLLGYFLKKVKAPHELSPSVVISIQMGSDRHLIGEYLDVFDKLGIYNVSFIETPVLQLLGSDANLDNNRSAMLIDLGYSQTTVCSLTLNGIIGGASIDFGGLALNNNIKKHLEQTKTTTFSDQTVEKIKMAVSGMAENDSTECIMQGIDSYSGKNKSVPVTCNDIYKPLTQYADKIIDFVRIIIKKLPAGAIEDFKESGIYLTGGCAHIYGLADYIAKELRLTVNYSYQGELASIIGCGYCIEDKKLLAKLKLNNN